MRRPLAIQLTSPGVGLAMSENPLQRSFAVDELIGQLGGTDTFGITRSSG